MQHRPRRSALYMPASNAKAIDKARTLDCDVVILDLEDAVAPEAKETARVQAVEAVKNGGFGRREVVIRCNGLDSPWGAADLKAAAAAGADAVLVPKINDAAGVAAYDAALSAAPAGTDLWAMIETGRSLFRLDEIAAARHLTLAALVRESPDRVFDEFALGCRSGTRLGLRDLRGYQDPLMLHAYERACGHPIPYRVVPRRPGDVAASFADPSKAARELGWRALRSLDEAVADTYRWQSTNPEGYGTA